MKSNFKKFLSDKVLVYATTVFIIVLNVSLYLYSRNHPIPRIQSRDATSGFSHDKASHFIYFFYYTGYFPLATLNPAPEYSKQGAWKEIKENGNNLIMEYKHWSRLGENLRIIAYLPDAWINGSPQNPSIKAFNALIFTIALLSILFAFASIGKPLLGISLSVVTNITPFFIFEVYGRNNIFYLLASVFLIASAINIKFLTKEYKPRYYLLLPVFTGIITGFFSEIRGEVSAVLISVVLIYAMWNEKIFKRIALIVLAGASFYLTKISIQKYFDYKFRQTYELVKKYGGHPYDGVRIKGHRFWHPVFCGLGDFDTKYGYKWNDTVAYNYAIPVLKKKYGLDLKYDGHSYALSEYYDKDSLYYKKFDDYDEYEEVVKEKVLSDIKNDPLWYVVILLKRIIRIFTHTVPFEDAGWITLFLFIWLWKQKKYSLVKFIIASLPLSITPFIIYSGSNTTYISYFSVIGISIIVCIFLSKFIRKINPLYET